MRSLATELCKFRVYRAPAGVAVTGVVVCWLWCASLVVRGNAYESARHVADSVLAFEGILLPLVWFIATLAAVSGDVFDGGLHRALVANSHRGKILIAKWGTSLIAAIGVAVLAWAAMAIAVLLRPDAALATELMWHSLPRLLVFAVTCVTLVLAVYLLNGFRGASWIVLSLVVWTQLIERVLGSALPGTAGMLSSPFRLVDFWVRMRWNETDFGELETYGFAPLLIYTALIGIVVAILFSRFSDSAGRPWGKKELWT